MKLFAQYLYSRRHVFFCALLCAAAYGVIFFLYAGGLVSASDLSVFCGGFYDGRIFPHEKAASGTAADFQV